MIDLIWSGSVDVIARQSGYQLLPLVAAHVTQVVAHLRVWPETEALLRQAATAEGRFGRWSSKALSHRIAERIASAVRDRGEITIKGSRAHLSITTKQCDAIARTLESDQIEAEAAAEEQVELAHETARKLAIFLEQHPFKETPSDREETLLLVKHASNGRDVRVAVQQKALSEVGKDAGFTDAPVFLRASQFEHRSADLAALRAVDRLRAGVEAFRQGPVPEHVSFGIPTVVRALPRSGKPWTGVALSIALANGEPVTAVWNVDSSFEP